MTLDGLARDEELFRDLLVREATRDQAKDVAFAGVSIAGWLLMPNEGADRSIAQKITRSKPICSS